MSISIDFSGKVALITGASQGIGAQTARTFHRAGATVVLNHPNVASTRTDAETMAAELNSARDRSTVVAAGDVSNPEAVQSMMQEISQRFGGIDFLINNAGIIRDRTIAKMPLEDWHAVIDVNLTGVFHCCKYGLEIMRDGGCIVSLGSIAALAGFFGQANYAAAKGGVLSMMRVLSREYARRNIRSMPLPPA